MIVLFSVRTSARCSVSHNSYVRISILTNLQSVAYVDSRSYSYFHGYCNMGWGMRTEFCEGNQEKKEIEKHESLH